LDCAARSPASTNADYSRRGQGLGPPQGYDDLIGVVEEEVDAEDREQRRPVLAQIGHCDHRLSVVDLTLAVVLRMGRRRGVRHEEVAGDCERALWVRAERFQERVHELAMA